MPLVEKARQNLSAARRQTAERTNHEVASHLSQGLRMWQYAARHNGPPVRAKLKRGTFPAQPDVHRKL